MICTSNVSESDREAIYRFLEERGALQNAWMIHRMDGSPLNANEFGRIILWRGEHNICGVAKIDQYPESMRPVNIKYNYAIYLDASDCSTLDSIIKELPEDKIGSFQMVFNPQIQDYLAALPESVRWDGDVYFSIDLKSFRPATGEEVIQVTPERAGLFARCEWRPRWESAPPRSRIYAILRQGGVATSASYSPITPRLPSGRKVVAVCALYTETRYRKQGLARRLVSYMTDLILQDGNIPMYWTEPDNTPSLHICRGLGYTQYGRSAAFVWRKPGNHYDREKTD